MGYEGRRKGTGRTKEGSPIKIGNRNNLISNMSHIIVVGIYQENNKDFPHLSQLRVELWLWVVLSMLRTVRAMKIRSLSNPSRYEPVYQASSDLDGRCRIWLLA